VQHIIPVKPSEAEGLVAQVYSQIKQDFGMIVEPFTLHSPIPALLAAVWMVSRESELVGTVPRETKEAVAASVSRLNQCPYCVDAHTIMLRATGKKKMAQLVSKEKYQNINPPKTRRIVEWALATLSPDSKPIMSPPFEAEEAPEIIGTTVFYHYINPLVSTFLGKSPLPFPFLKTPMKQIASRLFAKAVTRTKTAGTSLPLLPDKKLPKDLSWTKGAPYISGAYARFAGVIKDYEKTLVPKKTQEIIDQHVNDWNPKTMGFSARRVKEATLNMDSPSKTSATIALLTVFDPHQINRETINDFRRFFPEQNRLLGISAWASFTKARKIGEWLSQPLT
jgi:AhpD family alkylhydroperoxidase